MDDEFEIDEAIDLDELLVEVLRGDRRRRWSSAQIQTLRQFEIQEGDPTGARASPDQSWRSEAVA